MKILFNKKTLFLSLFVCSLLFVESGFSASGRLYESSASIVEVTIDGKWTTINEWNDATMYSFERGKNVLGYFLTKDDGGFLYVMIDYVSDGSIDDKDMGRLRVDTENDKGWGNLSGCAINGSCATIPGAAPLSDDFMIDLIWNKNFAIQTVYRGNMTNWIKEKENHPTIKSASSNDSENNPFSNLPHLTYEFAISRDLFVNKTEIGFSAFASNKGERDVRINYLTFPSTAHNLVPITWGNLTLATEYNATVSSSNTTTTLTTTSEAPQKSVTPIEPTIPKNITKQIPTNTVLITNPGSIIFPISENYIIIIGIIMVLIISFMTILAFRKEIPRFQR